MTVLKTDSLKLYKDKLENYISDLPITASESDIDGLMSDLHKYKISFFPSAFQYGDTNAVCRLNIHRKTGKATLTDLKSTTDINCNAVYDNKFNLHFYTSGRLWGGPYHIENILKGEGQCLGYSDSPKKYYMELEISSLDRIEFFPSWNAYGFYSEHYENGSRWSTTVTVDVECDGEKVFSGTISDLVKYDRVKIVFDSFNKVHLEKFNVGTAEAFKDYY